MSRKSLLHRIAAGASFLGLLTALAGAVPVVHADSSGSHADVRCHFSRSSVCWRAEHRHS